MYIDADTHVDENVETWSYVPEKFDDFRPAEMVFVDGQAPRYLSAEHHNDGLTARALFIDGMVYYRRTRSDALTQTTVDIRELYDVPARLKAMDELGVGVQVIYPSVLLNEVTDRPEVDVVICEAYNRWLGDRCRDSGGKLQWMAMLPFNSIPDALKELKRVKEDGAVGIMKRGYEANNRKASSAYFHPVYELAQDLEMPIAIHTGNAFLGYTPSFTKTRGPMRSIFCVEDAFLSLMMGGTLAKFPRLRFGFVEAGSGWLPNALFEANYDSAARHGLNRDAAAAAAAGETPKVAPDNRFEEFLEGGQLFVTCEAGENIPAITAQVGDNNIGIGTDYGHSDRSAILYAHTEVQSWTDVSQETKDKITASNAVKFYGLTV